MSTRAYPPAPRRSHQDVGEGLAQECRSMNKSHSQTRDADGVEIVWRIVPECHVVRRNTICGDEKYITFIAHHMAQLYFETTMMARVRHCLCPQTIVLSTRRTRFDLPSGVTLRSRRSSTRIELDLSSWSSPIEIVFWLPRSSLTEGRVDRLLLSAEKL